MKFTSILLTILSATAVTAYEHNAKSMLRGVDTKARVSGAPTICRKNTDCDGSDTCDLTDTVLSFCSHYTTNAKPHCCVSPDDTKVHAADGVPVSSPTVHAGIPAPDRVDPPVCRDNDDCPSYASYCDPDSDCSEYQSQGKKKCCVSPDEVDTLSKKAEAMEKVAKVLPLLKDAAKVKSDAMVKEDDNSTPICGCADPYACPEGSTCEDWGDCSFGCMTSVDPACDGVDPCDSKNCPNSKPICTTDWDACRATCSATSLKLKDAAKVKSDAMVKEDDNSMIPICTCDLTCRDGDECVFVNEDLCEKSCVAKPAVDPAPEACGGENPCDSKNCPNSKPICTPNYETCRGTCGATNEEEEA